MKYYLWQKNGNPFAIWELVSDYKYRFFGVPDFVWHPEMESLLNLTDRLFKYRNELSQYGARWKVSEITKEQAAVYVLILKAQQTESK